MSGRDALLALVRDAIQAGVERALDDERLPGGVDGWLVVWDDRQQLVLDVLAFSDDWPEYDAVLALIAEQPNLEAA